MNEQTRQIARRMVAVTEAWTKCERRADFDYFIPVKEFAEGMRMAASYGASDDLIRSLGMSLARAICDGEARVRIMVMQWKPACDIIHGTVSVYAAINGYDPKAEASAP